MRQEKKRLLTLAQMASTLRLQALELRREVDAGRIPAVRVGSKSLLFDPVVVMRVLTDRAVAAEKERGSK